MSYPAYTRAERIADGVIHVVGVAAALVAISYLIDRVAAFAGTGIYAAIVVYAICLLAMLSASAAYHLAADTRARPLLRRLDHAAIYMKIAGTITPLSVFLGTAFGYAVLGVVWIVAALGALTKLRMKRGRMTTGWVQYMALGWVGIALFIPLMNVLPGFSLWTMALGGALYCAGVVFYGWENLRYSNAIWHGFTLAASACFFAGIATALPATG